MGDLQFGVNIRSASSWSEYRGMVQRADELGFDVIAAPDHLGGFAPFSALTAAATISPRLRLRTYVLNAGFWNPALLAREVATLDLLSQGRAELGLGAGHMKSEHDDAHLPWFPADRRMKNLEDLLLQTRRRMHGDGHEPSPVQRSVPLMVGAMSTAGLALAARHADIVGFSGLRQVKGSAPGTFTFVNAEETARRVQEVRDQADGRSYRCDALLQVVAVGPTAADVAAEFAAMAPDRFSVEMLLNSPFALFAPTASEASAELRRRQEKYGFDCFTTHQPSMEALGAVIAVS